MSMSPSPSGDNGDRDTRGRFAPGNRAAVGNPHAKRVGQLRAMLLQAVTDDDWLATVRKLIEDAKAGDKAARSELFERVLGRPIEADLIERIEQLEQALIAKD
jgi:hypothetical protein